MAFDKSNLDTTGSASKGAGARAIYSTTDNKATVKADGYFDAASNEMADVKSILLVTSDATFEAKVTVTTGDVALAALDAFV